jgi:hypothetical protein
MRMNSSGTITEMRSSFSDLQTLLMGLDSETCQVFFRESLAAAAGGLIHMFDALARNGLGSSEDFRKLSTIFEASPIPSNSTHSMLLLLVMIFVFIKIEYAAITLPLPIMSVWLPSLTMLVE